MDDDVQHRMELVDRFVARLQQLTVDDWRKISASHRTSSDFYTLAVQLVSEATQMAGRPLSDEYAAFLVERDRRIDEMLMRLASESWEPIPRYAPLMAKAAANALLVRDTHGLNLGAFSEVFAPFRRFVDLRDPNAPESGPPGDTAR